MPKAKVPEFEDIAKLIDWGKVDEAILIDTRHDDRMLVYRPQDIADIKTMIWSACEKWLPRDLVEFRDMEVEVKEEISVSGHEVKGYLDLRGRLNGQLKPYDEYKDQEFILDWKTTEGELDTRWKNRIVDSWQWKIYGFLVPGAKIFNYRGISRRSEDDIHYTRDVILEVPEVNVKEVEEFLRLVNIQRDNLINIGADVWPRNMPDACNKFGRECPFKADCDTYTMPRWVPPMGKVMSHTAIAQFLTCPERHRRMLIEPEAEDSEEAGVGSGFHNGIAEVYRQAKEIKVV